MHSDYETFMGNRLSRTGAVQNSTSHPIPPTFLRIVSESRFRDLIFSSPFLFV